MNQVEIQLTILMPCLNEAETLASCIRKAQQSLTDLAIQGEILIADNGSSDGSQELARNLGARVVDITQKGYGHALRGGIEAAAGKFIIMADSASSPTIEKLRTRALSVYANYGSRSDVFSPLRQLLPPNVSEVGFFNGGDDPVSSLWKPHGSLIVREVTPNHNLTSLQARGLYYIFAGEQGLRKNLSQTIDQWTTNLRASIVATTILYPSVSRGPEVWVLILIP